MSPDKKPDFSDVKGSVRSTDQINPSPDFSDVRSSVRSTDELTSAAGEAGARTYTVVKGDTLSHIAKAHYGQASRWKDIFEANRGVLDDPDRIFPGQVLKLPDAGTGQEH